jgi:hypothetical protein
MISGKRGIEKEMRDSQHSIYMAHGVLGDDYKRLYGMVVDRRRANSLFPAHLLPLGEEGGVREESTTTYAEWRKRSIYLPTIQ